MAIPNFVAARIFVPRLRPFRWIVNWVAQMRTRLRVLFQSACAAILQGSDVRHTGFESMLLISDLQDQRVTHLTLRRKRADLAQDCALWFLHDQPFGKSRVSRRI